VLFGCVFVLCVAAMIGYGLRSTPISEVQEPDDDGDGDGDGDGSPSCRESPSGTVPSVVPVPPLTIPREIVHSDSPGMRTPGTGTGTGTGGDKSRITPHKSQSRDSDTLDEPQLSRTVLEHTEESGHEHTPLLVTRPPSHDSSATPGLESSDVSQAIKSRSPEIKVVVDPMSGIGAVKVCGVQNECECCVSVV